jgi:hypothetical protein
VNLANLVHIWRLSPSLPPIAIDLTINSRHYLVAERPVSLGPHIVRNVFGKSRPSMSASARRLAHRRRDRGRRGAVASTPRARFGIVWMVVAILPFAPFETGNVSRARALAVGLAWCSPRPGWTAGPPAGQAWRPPRSSRCSLSVSRQVRRVRPRRRQDVVCRRTHARQFLISLRRDLEIPMAASSTWIEDRAMPHRFSKRPCSGIPQSDIRLVVSDRPDSR